MVRAVDDMNGSNRDVLEHWFRVGVERCLPRTVLPPVLPQDPPVGRNIVLGAGKAAAAMAAVAHERLRGKTVGLVVTRYGHGETASTGNIEVVEASHPVPDVQSEVAAARMLELAAGATPDDRVLFMMSGGGSALLCAPIDGVLAEKKRAVTGFLLHSGAPIQDMNCVRKHLSRIKGGGLAHAASAAELRTFAISDVVGDALTDIASGPSVHYERDVATAIVVLEKYGYAGARDFESAMLAADVIDAPLHDARVVANAAMALAAIAREAANQGWTPVLLGDDLEGRALDIGRAHAGIARHYRSQPGRHALISGGELTVEVKNTVGRGGPNLEYLASLMLNLDGLAGVEAIACDSDGIDGSEDNAGGYIGPDSLERARTLGIDPGRLLELNDTYVGFEALGDLIVTGPTLTNINDIRVILVDPAQEA